MQRLVAILLKPVVRLVVGAAVGFLLSGFLPGRPPRGVLEDEWYLRRAIYCGGVMAVVAVAAGNIVIKTPFKEVALGLVCGALLGVASASAYAKLREVSDATLPANDGKRRAGLQWAYIRIALPVCLPTGVLLGGITGYVVARRARLTNGSSGDGRRLCTVS